MKKIIFPGSFDPITNGHLDLISRACKLSENLVIAVAKNESKNTFFTLEERTHLIKESTSQFKNIEVIPFSGLLVDFAAKNNAQALVRGIRSATDCDYEIQLSQVNKALDPELETILLSANASTGFISSTVVKEVFIHQGDISNMAPECVKKAFIEKLALN